MNVGLIDVDGYKGYPNFALMKISAQLKSQKHQVEWLQIDKEYDVVYASKVFTFTPDFDYSRVRSKHILKGGTGYNFKIKLPPEIEAYNILDYTLYPDCEFSLVFFSRGCIRNCKFCLVRQKEGHIHPVDPIEFNPNGKWIDVLDNNFFANPNWRPALEYLKSTKQPINFRGVDIRIMDEEQATALNTVKIKNSIFIAWDNPKQDLEPRIKQLVKYIKPYKLRCYVLVGFNSSVKEDLHRINTLRKYKILPYVMVYKDYDNPKEKTPYQKDLTRWANNVFVYKKCENFADYEPRKGFKCSAYLKEDETIL